MMFKVEISTLEGYFTANSGSDADLRAGGRRAGTAVHRLTGAVGNCAIRTVIRTGERVALWSGHRSCVPVGRLWMRAG
jgi:hypothetical protein